MMDFEEIKDLTNYLRFQTAGEFEKTITYNEKGDDFYIIIKGLASVQVPNPTIDDWKLK